MSPPQVLIDNEEYDRDQLPWTGMGVTIFAMPGKVTVVVFTGLGVQIRYNEISAAFSIHVPSKTFFNKTAGLCGSVPLCILVSLSNLRNACPSPQLT